MEPTDLAEICLRSMSSAASGKASYTDAISDRRNLLAYVYVLLGRLEKPCKGCGQCST